MGKKERVGRLLEMHADNREDVEVAVAGDIVAVAGLKDTTTGDSLTAQDAPVILERMDFPDPVIKIAIEPMMKVEVVCPEESMGDVIGDLNSRRGMVGELNEKPGGMREVNATVPLSEMFNYVSRLRSVTKGRGNYTMVLDKYDVVPPNIAKEICDEKKVTAA